MSAIADAIAKSFAHKFDEDAQAVSELMRTEARKTKQEVTVAKLATIKAVKKELAEARAETTPDPDVIDALVALLAECKAS